ncbi:hypothetical protein KGF57_003408 [Candida theae]|uniref:Tubulin binding cofactor C-like domain-containing protein n=1 Tax=Candida theae TaxID=1198502 RepID=A0AAD5BD34_9ASCO|nr:uncharacterized protein KGF57_003408 [Candida theae]KAI5956688.1 hypothetical protein KGF57_003408 [Candida theae]
MDLTSFNKLRIDIITSTSLDQLQQIQQDFQNLIDSQAPGTSFTKKLETENVNSIHRLIQSKQNQLSKVNFKFVGEPQPPTPINKSNRDSNVFSDLKYNSTSVLDTDYKCEADHIYISKFSNSVVSLESKSISLQSGQNSVCYLHSSGPVFVHDAVNCILIISCHQARLHKLRNSLVIVQNREKRKPIIIENCSNLMINDVDIDDFNHPSKSTKSPNYKVLQSEVLANIQQQIHHVNLSNLEPTISSILHSVKTYNI